MLSHSSLAAQTEPLGFLARHFPEIQKDPAQQWVLLVQLVRQVFPPHEYGQHGVDPSASEMQLPEPLQYWVMYWMLLVHVWSWQTVSACQYWHAPPPSQSPFH